MKSKIITWASRLIPVMSSVLFIYASMSSSITCKGVLYQPKTPKTLS